MASSQMGSGYEIVDIGGSNIREFLLDALQEFFFNKNGSEVPYVCDTFASSDEGMELWSTIISLPTWYQTREEIGLLHRWGPDIAKHIQAGSSLVDLGSGDVTKITPLLDCLESLKRHVIYYCVDVSRSSIERGLQTLSSRYKYITLIGLWGTFDGAKAYLENISSPRLLASLGAEIGNDTHENALADLKSWTCRMKPGDQFLLGIDGTQDKRKIWTSYHQRENYRLIRIGMANVNATMGHDWFRDEDWRLDGQIREEPLSHRFYFTAVRDVSCPEAGISFRRGDRIECYASHRKTPAEMRELFQACGLKELQCWKSPDGDIYEYLLVLDEE